MIKQKRIAFGLIKVAGYKSCAGFDVADKCSYRCMRTVIRIEGEVVCDRDGRWLKNEATVEPTVTVISALILRPRLANTSVHLVPSIATH